MGGILTDPGWPRSSLLGTWETMNPHQPDPPGSLHEHRPDRSGKAGARGRAAIDGSRYRLRRLWPGDGRLPLHAHACLEREPRRPGLREQGHAGNASANSLLRTRRRYQCRRQRRRHARPGDSLHLSCAEPGRNPHGRRGQKRAGDVSARPHRRKPPLPHPARRPTRFSAHSDGSSASKTTPSRCPGLLPSSTSTPASCSPSANSTSGSARN